MDILLILAGLAGLVFGAVNLVRPLGKWRVTTRKRGAAVLGASLLLTAFGASLAPEPEEATLAAPATTVVEATTTSPASTTASTIAPSPTVSPPATSTTIPLPDVPRAEALFAAPSAGPSGDPAVPAPPGSATMTVIGITDGDTIEVRLDSGATDTVRLIGVNSPESGECFSEESALVLAALIPVGSEIGATGDRSDRDQFDRLLRYLWVGGLSVNQELVRRGAAIARRYPPDTAMASRLELAEEEARTQELGLWRQDACGTDAGTEVEVIALEADSPGNDNETLDQELVRLRNEGAVAVDMTGWVLKDESASHRYEFPGGFTLAADGVVSIHTGCGTDTPDSLYWCNDGAVWNNDGDTAFLLDHNGNIVHSLAYAP